MRLVILPLLLAFALAGNPLWTAEPTAAEPAAPTPPDPAAPDALRTDLAALARPGQSLVMAQAGNIEELIASLEGDSAFETCVVRNIHLGRFAEALCAQDPGFTDGPQWLNEVNGRLFFLFDPYPHCDGITGSCVVDGVANRVLFDIGSSVIGDHNYLHNSWHNTVIGGFNALTDCSDTNVVLGNNNHLTSTGGCGHIGFTILGDDNIVTDSEQGNILGSNNHVVDSEDGTIVGNGNTVTSSTDFLIQDLVGGGGNDDGSGDNNVMECTIGATIDGDDDTALAGPC